MIKVTQAFLPLLGAEEDRSTKPGKIVQISSVNGKVGFPFVAPYVGSKFAMEGVSEVMRRELQLFGIDVIVIGPGAVKTPIWYKGTDDESNQQHLKTPFGDALFRFREYFVKAAIETGLEADEVARSIVAVFEKKKPKTRYAYVANKFRNWILPRLLPARRFDKIIGKGLKLIK